jgi:hypothetical protein
MANLTLPNGQHLINVHEADRCAGAACPIHNVTWHHMRDWEQCWMPGDGMYRICEHGEPHPDPDDIRLSQNLHACGCGCCVLSLDRITDDLKDMIEELS